MPQPFDPTPDAKRALEKLADEIPEIQQTLIRNHHQLKSPDRAAHQQQIAGSLVRLKVAERLSPELDGLGLFHPAHEYVGIGRVSTGLGCPHLETDPDFLGLMLAFRSPAGQRVDFVGLNDPAAPTDTAEDFIALLKATADAAGTTVPFGSVGSLDILNSLASTGELLVSLVKHARLKAPGIAAHVIRQTARVLRSSSAYQQYWTGIVSARGVLGKFTFVPTVDAGTARGISPGGTYLSEDWRRRQSHGPLDFTLYWIPFISEEETPTNQLTRTWQETHRVSVGTVAFPMTDPNSTAAKMTAVLASEMGANPGNWVEKSDGESPGLPSTEFTAARSLVYKKSQAGRGALSEDSCESFFERGEISPQLAAELIRRYRQKRSAGHAVPDVGEIPIP